MADRRMFSTKIVESDAFYDLTPMTQAVYFHLCMAADDDGFINNPRSVVRGMGLTNNTTLEILIEKKFLIKFPSGIVCIKHWRINNYIQKDRYKETTYTEEKKLLYVKENGAYTLNPDHCIQGTDDPVYKVSDPMDTQNSIDKDRLGKDRLDKDRLDQDRLDKSKGKNGTDVPPTLEDVTSYCQERNNSVDPEAFIAFYESKGWKVGGAKMKNWKAAIITWEKRMKEKNLTKWPEKISDISERDNDWEQIRKNIPDPLAEMED